MPGPEPSRRHKSWRSWPHRNWPRWSVGSALRTCAALLLVGFCQALEQPDGLLEGSMLRQQRHRSRASSRVRVRLRDGSYEPDQVVLASNEPVTIFIMTPHYFGADYARDVDNCTLGSAPLKCSFIPKTGQPILVDQVKLSREADAVWWHAPHSCLRQAGPWGVTEDDGWSPFKARPEQFSVIASMESSTYYRCLDNAEFMANFDIEMTYRRRGEVQMTYWSNGYLEAWQKQHPLPLSEKKDAVVYINSNCKPPSRRNQIVQQLSKQPGIVVDALGICMNTGLLLPRGAGKKMEAFRMYKFCIAMENSIAEDYVTEKVYDALVAGCVPIYLGAPNIADFVPSADAIIDYAALGSPEALAAELRRLASNATAYEEKLRWRDDPASWGAGFKEMLARAKDDVHSQCQLCQVVAKRKAAAAAAAPSVRPSSPQRWRRRNVVPGLRAKRLKIQYRLAGEQ